jgi:hypothetical protein
MPFHGESIASIKQAVKEKDIIHEIENDPKWRQASALAKDFMKLGFSKSQTKRTNLKKLLEHPWLRDTQLPMESTV